MSAWHRRVCAPPMSYALAFRGACPTALSRGWPRRTFILPPVSGARASPPTSTTTKPTSTASLRPCGARCRPDPTIGSKLRRGAEPIGTRRSTSFDELITGTSPGRACGVSVAKPIEHRYVRIVVIGGVAPAVLVVIGHAALGEGLHLLERAGSLRLLQSKQADQLVAAGIVHLVELVAGAELAADCIPQELHDLDALFVIDAVGAAHVARKIPVDVGVFEITRAARQIDQSRGDHLLDDGAHGRIGLGGEDTVGDRGAHVGQHGAANPWVGIVGHGIGQGPEQVTPADHLTNLRLYAAKGLHARGARRLVKKPGDEIEFHGEARAALEGKTVGEPRARIKLL